MNILEQIAFWIINLNLIGDHGHIIGFLWLIALIITFFKRLKDLVPGKHDQPTRWKSILSYRKVAAISFSIAWFIQVMVDECITFLFNLASGAWSMIEFQKGAFTIEKLFWMKADSYFQIALFFFVFTIANVWQYFHVTKRTLFWLSLVMLYQGILAYLHIWNHHAYTGTPLILVFFLTYPEFRILTGFLGSNLVKKPEQTQNSQIEKTWFDKFNFLQDKRNDAEFHKLTQFFRLNQKKGLLLDAGCGYGDFTQKLSALGINVIGIDLSHKMLKANPCSTIQANALHLPFKPGIFDYVFCSGFLHHFTNLQEILPKLRGALKTQGQLLIYEPSGSNLFAKLANMIGHTFFPESWLMKHGATPNERLYRMGSFLKELRKAGFSIDKNATWYVKGRTFLPFGITKLMDLAHSLLPSRITDSHILIEASL